MGKRASVLVWPAIALMGVVILLPLGQAFLRSVSTPTWSLDRYVELFTDEITMVILGRTVVTAVIVTVIVLILGYPFAYLMTRVNPRMRSLLLIVVLIPFWTSVMARNFAWLVLLQNGGVVEGMLAFIGFPDVVLYGTTAGVVVVMTQIMLPFMVLPLYATLGSIDRRLLLAARGLGSHPIIAFWKVFWPLSRGGVIGGLILVFTLSAGFYVTPALIGSPQQALIAQLLSQRALVLVDFAAAGALGVFVLVLTLMLVAWATRVGGNLSAIGAVMRTSSGRRA